MVTINPNQTIVTLINTFTVKPENQEKLIDVLNEATEKVIKHMTGFVSASIHRGLDRNRVANYAQWKSRENMVAMLKDPKAQEHLKMAEQLSEKYEPVLYAVDSSHGENM